MLFGVRMPEEEEEIDIEKLAKEITERLEKARKLSKDLSETFEVADKALTTTRGTISVLDKVSPLELERYALTDLPVEVKKLETKLEALKTKLEPFTKLPPDKIVEYWATRDLLKRIESIGTNVDTRLKDFDKRLDDHKDIFNELKGRINWFTILIIILALIMAIASNIDKIIKAVTGQL